MQVAGSITDTDIRGLTADSRTVRPGYLFAAIPGNQADGRDYIPDALGRGAVAVLAPEGTRLDQAADATLLTDRNPRRRLALMAARYFGAQPDTIAAVTGTNGKTSVTAFTRQIWSHLGRKAASLGTLGLVAPGREEALPLTTLDPVDLHRVLCQLVQDRVDHLALEASSHGLDQFRLDGVRVSAAAFTNLSRDHFDYHANPGDYLAAKTRLFDELLRPGGTAVLNVDVPEWPKLREICLARGHRIIPYGRAADPLDGIRLDSMTARPDGLDIRFVLFGAHHEVSLGLVGDFQAMNALCALALVIACDGEVEGAVQLLPRLQGARGRMEHVTNAPDGGAVYVDYAHTPGALETVLTALRPHTRGRLVCVFGAGGDRDPGKRPLMGAVVARLADRPIVTDDNPRGEDPAAIRAAIVAACPGAEEVGDRAEAIRRGMDALAPDDVLIIAGKGHERGQTVGERVLPFDDADTVRRIAQERAP
ncbi:MAG: UDP-N-acetylmuramoyl-L-alanyl-D-glutamate--2,6-diaminopimelate ligase [Alphaproteobacteria bacterium]|nr:UDP-N-acetylmuramoyl-L-alanyl-D-glutamate--2,6-diaminopimelate ligase [Alphaproteobacteria bacterium]